jgi:hypothetical protein
MHRVQALLMGGQACVFYGAAEFSRDTDIAVLAQSANLERLRQALAELDAETIAVPPFEARHLLRGHSIHFRCRHPEAFGMRLDVMSRMRGVDDFDALWARRTTVLLSAPGGTREAGAADGQIPVEIMGIEDLVRAKKTQRDKDWPMLRRLVEAHYFANRAEASDARVRFWLQELRSPELLVEAACRFGANSAELLGLRPLLALARPESLERLAEALRAEEDAERALDRAYWAPLRAELEALRHAR